MSYVAYFDCRKTKRYSNNALKFEIDYESNLNLLKTEIDNGSYNPRRSIAFIVNNPVKREIFAADFRDRIVHHWLINKLNPLFEGLFIQDSYACRVGKGTHYGIKRVDSFIKACSEHYTKDCYILKLDILGFFMSINKDILFNLLEVFIKKNYNNPDKELVLDITKKIMFNDPTNNCIIQGSTEDWTTLPKSKSLFNSRPNCGLPIGNLTSQIFANFFMNVFDSYVKTDLQIQYYGRYVDDFVIVDEDKNKLSELIPVLREFLETKLQLSLHPKKIYLQHYNKGVKFLGAVIKQNRIYISNRTKGNFFNKIKQQNILIKTKNITKEDKDRFLSSMNSYLGLMKHYQTYNIRKKLITKHLYVRWFKIFTLKNNYQKFVFKNKKISKNTNWF